VEVEKRVQRDQLKAAVDRVGDIEISEKDRLPCVSDDRAIGADRHVTQGVTPKQCHYRRLNPRANR
jgi:hypothetical protein